MGGHQKTYLINSVKNVLICLIEFLQAWEVPALFYSECEMPFDFCSERAVLLPPGRERPSSTTKGKPRQRMGPSGGHPSVQVSVTFFSMPTFLDVYIAPKDGSQGVLPSHEPWMR